MIPVMLCTDYYIISITGYIIDFVCCVDHVSTIVVASGIIEIIVNALQSSNLVNMELINAVLPVFAYISTSGIEHLYT